MEKSYISVFFLFSVIFLKQQIMELWELKQNSTFLKFKTYKQWRPDIWLCKDYKQTHSPFQKSLTKCTTMEVDNPSILSSVGEGGI